MSYKAKENHYTECWTDLSYSGGHLLAPFFIFIGVSSFLIGVFTLSLILVSAITSVLGFAVGVIACVVFLCSGVIHLSVAHNFRNRVRVVEAYGEDFFKITFWRARKNEGSLSFFRKEIEQVARCPDPKNIRDYLLSLPREPSCFCFSLIGGRAFQVAGEDDSVQELLDILSVAKK